jgi:RNA polymerase sigma-70 factor (ECF subfamily)
MTDNEQREKPVEAAVAREASPPVPEKLEKVFLDHHVQVFRAAYRITGNASDAEDVLQTVFLRLLRQERGEGLSESPASYLHRAAVNAALDLARHRRTWKTTPIEEAAPHLVTDDSGGPDRKREERETRDRIRAALADMSPKMAEIFVLRYFEGYDNHEIARLLRTSRSTVAVLLHRARGRLKKQIPSFLGEPS